MTVFRRDDFKEYKDGFLPRRRSLDHTIYINLILGHKMSKAFQALRRVHSVHVQVVDGKEPGTGEGSQDAELGTAND